MKLSILIFVTASACSGLSDRESSRTDDAATDIVQMPSQVTGAHLTFENAKLRCDHTELGKREYQVQCDVVARSASGKEFIPTSVDSNLKFSRLSYQSSEGKVTLSCENTASKTSYSCDAKLESLTATIEFSVEISHATNRVSKKDSDVVKLPFQISFLTGVVASLPYEYRPTHKDPTSIVGDIQKGFQLQKVDPKKLALRNPQIIQCEYENNDQRIFLSDSGFIYQYVGDDVVLFAGNLLALNSAIESSTSRLKVHLDTDAVLACSKHGLLALERNKQRILELRLDEKVELVWEKSPMKGAIAQFVFPEWIAEIVTNRQGVLYFRSSAQTVQYIWKFEKGVLDLIAGRSSKAKVDFTRLGPEFAPIDLEIDANEKLLALVKLDVGHHAVFALESEDSLLAGAPGQINGCLGNVAGMSAKEVKFCRPDGLTATVNGDFLVNDNGKTLQFSKKNSAGNLTLSYYSHALGNSDFTWSRSSDVYFVTHSPSRDQWLRRIIKRTFGLSSADIHIAGTSALNLPTVFEVDATKQFLPSISGLHIDYETKEPLFIENSISTNGRVFKLKSGQNELVSVLNLPLWEDLSSKQTSIIQAPNFDLYSLIPYDCIPRLLLSEGKSYHNSVMCRPMSAEEDDVVNIELSIVGDLMPFQLISADFRSNGNLIVSDAQNEAIWEVDPQGRLIENLTAVNSVSFAKKRYKGEISQTQAIGYVKNLRVRNSDVFFYDSFNQAISKINNGRIYHVMGLGDEPLVEGTRASRVVFPENLDISSFDLSSNGDLYFVSAGKVWLFRYSLENDPKAELFLGNESSGGCATSSIHGSASRSEIDQFFRTGLTKVCGGFANQVVVSDNCSTKNPTEEGKLSVYISQKFGGSGSNLLLAERPCPTLITE